MALFSAASYQSQSLPTNVQLSVFCSFTIKIGTISYDGSTDNGIVCQLRITHLLCISQNHRNLQAMLSKSFCSLNQKVSRKTTCSGLFVLRLKDLNPNDSEHGFIIYALLSEYFYSQPMSGWLPTTLWEGSGPRLLQLRLLEFDPNAFFHKNSKSGRNRLMWFGPFRLFSIKSALLISAYVSGCLFSALRNFQNYKYSTRWPRLLQQITKIHLFCPSLTLSLLTLYLF